MLQRVCSTIVHGKCGLGEPSREHPFLYSVCERWPRHLVECYAHLIVSLAFGEWIFVFALKVVVFDIRERLIKRSSWSTSIATILFIVKRRVRTGGSSFSPFAAQLSLQMVNLQLQGSSILLMREMALTSGLTPTSLGSMHTPLPVSSSLEVDKMIFTLGPHRFCLVWTWTYHGFMLDSL